MSMTGALQPTLPVDPDAPSEQKLLHPRYQNRGIRVYRSPGGVTSRTLRYFVSRYFQ